MFDPSTGIEKTCNPPALPARQTFLLLHRGRELNPAELSIGTAGDAVTTVLYEGRPLTDGVWLPLRLRRVNEYPVDRPWSHDYDHWWQRVYATIDELSLGTITPEVASAKFAAGTETAPSLHDEYCRVRGIILADSVLTSTERTACHSFVKPPFFS